MIIIPHRFDLYPSIQRVIARPVGRGDTFCGALVPTLGCLSVPFQTLVDIGVDSYSGLGLVLPRARRRLTSVKYPTAY